MPNERRRRPFRAWTRNYIAAEVIVCRSFHNWAASLVRKLQGNPAYTAAQRVAIVLKAVGALRADARPRGAEAELGLVA